MNWCWITGHRWKMIAYFNYIDTSFCKESDAGAKSNCITLQCQKCGNLKTKENWAGGHIEERMLDWLR